MAALFPNGTRLIHHKTGGEYEIKLGPDDCVRKEDTGELAYVYKAPDSPTLWVRGQGEMEDGRFGVLA